MTLYMIGHGLTPFPRFLATIDEHKVDVVVDVRFKPFSARNPAFKESKLRELLPGRYVWDPRLGNPAMFDEGVIAPAERAAAIDELERRIRSGQTVAIMCSEGKSKGCHRSGIAAELSLRGITIVDLVV